MRQLTPRFRSYWLHAIIVGCFAAALALNAIYTTYSLHSELSKGCIVLQAQAKSRAYPADLRRDFAALARQRGC